MSSLALRSSAWSARRMADQTERERIERERDGRALENLRKKLGYSQDAIVTRIAELAVSDRDRISLATYKNYISGKTPMSRPKLLAALRAIGSNLEEHALEVAKLVEDAPGERRTFGVSDRSSAFLPVGGHAHAGLLRRANDDQPEVIDVGGFMPATARVLPIADSAMSPYAKPGGIVVYDTRKPPSPGDGCVIQFKDERQLIRQFERIVSDQLHVSFLYPETTEETYSLTLVEGIYAITLRSD